MFSSQDRQEMILASKPFQSELLSIKKKLKIESDSPRELEWQLLGTRPHVHGEMRPFALENARLSRAVWVEPGCRRLPGRNRGEARGWHQVTAVRQAPAAGFRSRSHSAGRKPPKILASLLPLEV